MQYHFQWWCYTWWIMLHLLMWTPLIMTSLYIWRHTCFKCQCMWGKVHARVCSLFCFLGFFVMKIVYLSQIEKLWWTYFKKMDLMDCILFDLYLMKIQICFACLKNSNLYLMKIQICFLQENFFRFVFNENTDLFFF